MSMSRTLPAALAALTLTFAASSTVLSQERPRLASDPPPQAASDAPAYQYRLLAASRISTMQKELNDAAQAGYRFLGFMKGDTGFGGDEVVCILGRDPDASDGRFEYLLLATRKTSTMQQELQAAADQGYEYRGQTIHNEIVIVLERDRSAPVVRYEYLLLATRKTSTMQQELDLAGSRGYVFVGVTVAQTPLGGQEVVTILRRPASR